MRSARFGKGDRWQVEYVDDEGHMRYPSFPTRTAAEKFAVTVETDLLRGDYVDPARGRELFRDYVTSVWLPGQVQHAPATADTLASDLRNHILPVFGDRPIGAIRRSAVVAWVANRSTVLAARTVHRVYGWLATICKSAVADGLIARTPCLNINLPPITRTRVNPLPTLAVEALIDAAPDRWQSALVVAAGMGMREGEILGLAQDRVDFLGHRRRIRVDRQAQTPDRGTPYLRPVKREASERSIPLPDVVGQALGAHLKAFPPLLVEVDEYTDRAAGAAAKRVKVRLLYPATRGGLMRRDRFIDTVWKPTVKAAEKALRARSDEERAQGLDDDAAATDAAADRLAGKVDFHEMRHFYASLLKLGNVASNATFGSFGDRPRAGVSVPVGFLRAG